ncbi:Gti1/Pac2 family-domain-containing protein [Lentinula guzmanii]|uniref:Gti1/Pac2 family-domain-containing protein n=1 Tax=Lentinula guzmanii TaxID=2804957 RepID=A0AA38J618_9AGAR|nr:Gti1/Pac2 family-domain-containing protein [Lentinula guzmanii]
MSTSSGTSSASHPPPPTTWNDPPWIGWIETTGDALLILEAARRGLIPRVTRRLVDSERKMISSGSVFVFDEDESGIKRWTDGFFWSPSRILGNFLLYRETDKRGPGHKGNSRSQEGGEAQDGDASQLSESHSLSRPKSETSNNLGFDKLRERTLMGSLTNSYKFKSDGLMKKTFSLTIGGVAQHLISYYRIEDVENGRLRSPSSLPELASLDISPEYLDKTHFRNPPKVEVGPDGVPRYRGEADELESSTSPSILTAPLSTGLPLLTDGRITDSVGKRPNKRFEPYPAAQPAPKRQRKRNDGRSPESPAEEESSVSRQRSSSQTPTPSTSSQPHRPSPTYADPTPGSAAQPAHTGYFPVPSGYAHPQGMYHYPSHHQPPFMPAQGATPLPSYPVGQPYNGSSSPGSGSGPGIPPGQPGYYGFRQPYPYPTPYPPGTTWASYPYPVPPFQIQQPIQPVAAPAKDGENQS